LTASVLKALLFVSSTTVVLDNAINDFRLTLTTGVPVTTADVTGATTIYCTPYRGNRIALYSGSAWVIDTSAEFSLALGTLTASLPYDVFCYDNAGVPTLEFLAWASATTRATALAYQDGILVKSGAATRRYLGTFYTSSTTQTADAVATRYLENYYNTVDRTLAGVFSTDRSTTSGTYAEINSEIQIKWVQGNIENPVRFNAIGSFSSGTSSQGATAVGIDSTTVATGGLETTTTATTAWSGFSIVNNVTPATGYHYATLLGASGGTTTWASATSLMKTKTWLSAMKKG
jgi:hypothetical protein